MAESFWFNAAHCEGPGCDTWSRSPKEHGFVVIHWPNPDGDTENHYSVYCCVDCMMKDAVARFAPIEVIER